jgi:hypothetical protein
MSEPVLDELSVPQLLRAAAAQIRKRGWNQGWWFNGAGGICLSAALNVSLGTADPAVFPLPGTRQHDLRKHAVTALSLAVGADNPVMWNDAPERRVGEVLAAFEAAAVLAEESDAEATGDSTGQRSDH